MIVVTGSNGFIGSNLIKGLNEIGYKDIIAVDDHNDPSLKENIIHCEIKDYLNIDEFINLVKRNEIDGNKFKAIFNYWQASQSGSNIEQTLGELLVLGPEATAFKSVLDTVDFSVLVAAKLLK